jgi:hypothetical protein
LVVLCFIGIIMIYMEHVTKNKFYLLLVDCDMFDTWYVKCVSGGIGVNARARTTQQLCSSTDDAWQVLTDIEYKKRQQGYRYVDFEDIPERVLKRLKLINQSTSLLSNNNRSKQCNPDLDRVPLNGEPFTNSNLDKTISPDFGLQQELPLFKLARNP